MKKNTSDCQSEATIPGGKIKVNAKKQDRGVISHLIHKI